jgi:hypothetical protein
VQGAWTAGVCAPRLPFRQRQSGPAALPLRPPQGHSKAWRAPAARCSPGPRPRAHLQCKHQHFFDALVAGVDAVRLHQQRARLSVKRRISEPAAYHDLGHGVGAGGGAGRGSHKWQVMGGVEKGCSRGSCSSRAHPALLPPPV